MNDDNDSLVPGVFSGDTVLPAYAGPWLTPGQYEVLCRYAMSREYGMPLHWVKTGHLQGPSRMTRHQIDLYWTSSDGVCDILCIANAKFVKRTIELTDLMTLLGVQQAVRAHKAMLITNTGYTEGCVAQAKESGVALLVVRPAADFDPGVLPTARAVLTDAREMEKVFNRRVTPAYRMNVVHRAFEVYGAGRSGAVANGVDGFAVAGSGGEAAGVPAAAQGRPAWPAAVANKMVSGSVPPGPGAGPFGMRRK